MPSRPKPDRPVVAVEATPTPRLRLLKVAVQATFVLDDPVAGVREVRSDAFEIAGPDWPAWAPASFDDAHLARILDAIQNPPPAGR